MPTVKPDLQIPGISRRERPQHGERLLEPPRPGQGLRFLRTAGRRRRGRRDRFGDRRRRGDAVRGERHADAQAPALARPDLTEEPVDVDHHLRRRLAGQHLLEMPPGQVILALEVEGAGELEAHAHQSGIADQHGAEIGDGLAQQRVARLRLPALLLRVLQRRDAGEEQHAVPMPGVLHQQAQHAERQVVAAQLHQRPRLGDLGS